MRCLDLTPFTVTPREERAVTVLRVETDRRTAVSLGVGAVVGVVAFAFVSPFLPVTWALLVIPIFAVATAWGFARRSRHGQHLHNAERLYRKSQSRVGEFFIGTEPLDLAEDRMSVLHVLGQVTRPVDVIAWPAHRRPLPDLDVEGVAWR